MSLTRSQTKQLYSQPIVNEYVDNNIDDIIQKQYLQKLNKQIENRNELIIGLKIRVYNIGYDTRFGIIYETWDNPNNAKVLERYMRYY